MAKTRDYARVIAKKIADNPELRVAVEREIFNAKIAEEVFAARQRAGMTQHALAERVGTRQPVIARWEDADYQGHSLSTLWRIAQATNHDVEVTLVPKTIGAITARTTAFEDFGWTETGEWNPTIETELVEAIA
jgi:transcriptional regulator with XRE-family HTH domain